MRGAVSVISLLLITGIVLALIGVAYSWGVPMIEKGSTITQYQTSESFIKQLDRTIVEIANTGSGSKTLDIPGGGLRLIPESIETDNNSLIFDFQTNQPLVFSDSVIPIDTPTLGEPGTYGTDEPRTITLYASDAPTGYLISLKLRYRLLEAETKCYKIVLDGLSEKTGTSKAIVSFVETVTVPDGCDAGNLIATHIKVDLV
jgi:hypothetical protein